MRICHITSVHPLDDGRILEKECNSLADTFDEVYLVGIGEVAKYNNVNIIGVISKNTDRIARVLIINKQVIKYALSLGCDVYHLHDPELLIYAKMIKRAGHKVIFDSHEDVPRQIYDKKWIPSFFRAIVSMIYEKYEKGICKKLDGIVVATERIQQVFRNHGLVSTVIHNYPIIAEDLNRGEVSTNNQLCFAGSLSESNGIIQLIDVVESMPNIKLVLAGRMDNTVKQRYQIAAKERINYLGIISHKNVKELYKNSAIGVVADLPTGNNIEGLPIKMFEFMEAGLPIITSNYPIRREIFAKYPCGILIDPYNADEYKRAINKLLSDEKYRETCRINGIKAVTMEYNWRHEESKLIDLYKIMERTL